MSDINDFTAVVKEIIELFDNLLVIEDKKLNSISINNIDKLDEFMKDEQAYVLKLRGLDKKREKIQENLSFQNLSFREILTHIEDVSQRENLNLLFSDLNNKLSLFKASNESLKKLIEVQLHNIDFQMSSGLNSTDTYNKNGEKNETATGQRFGSRKI